MPRPLEPPPLATLSLWQRTVRSHPLLASNGTTPLVSETDIVVIGSGLCGATIAHSLLTSSNLRVACLEARELASGASGRNAGHCRPDHSRGFPAFERNVGAEEARAVLESEAEVFRRVDEFITTNNIECEWTRRTTYDTSLSEEFTATSAAAEEALRGVGGSPPMKRYDADAAEITRVPSAQAAWAWDAATLNPAQLTLAIHQLCVDTGRYDAYAFAPGTSVDRDGDRWKVITPRGAVVCSKVVYATNGYAAGLLPELEALVVPVKAQAHKLTPPPNKSFAPLSASYSLRESTSIFYSVYEPPSSATDNSASRPDGSVVLGVSRALLPSSETAYRVDDGDFNPQLASAAISAFCRLVPGGWEAPSDSDLERLSLRGSDAVSGKGFEYAWSGIIGCTPDNLPLIGPRVGYEGQYVAVGYNGHGMARIFLTAPALAGYILHGTWDSDRDPMPRCFRFDEGRLERLRRLVADGRLAR